MIHLDALILCEKEKATFICDDLFFRKLQVWQKSPILMFYLYCYNIIRIKKFIVQIVMEFSKTKLFIYSFKSQEQMKEASQLIKNLLDGELKQKYNEEFLASYREVQISSFRNCLK